MDKKLAFLGLGIMGSQMSRHLADAGFDLSVWNRTKGRPAHKVALDAGATLANSIEQAVRDASIIFLCLPDVPDVESVLFGQDGVADSARSGALVVDTSTIGPAFAKEVAIRLSKKGLRFLDAPFSGGDIGGKNATLTFMVGGSQSDFEECKPYFEVLGKNIHYCGSVGSGQSIKLCNQILCAINMVGVCEALHLGQFLGVDLKMVLEICQTGAGGSWALSNLGPRVLSGDFSPGFVMDHMINNLRLVRELSDKNIDLPGIDLSDRLFKEAQSISSTEAAKVGTHALIRAYTKK